MVLLCCVLFSCVVLSGKPMGAVSAFTTGNYHCQPLDVESLMVFLQLIVFSSMFVFMVFSS